MADNTKIEWSEATWNPITGCSLASPGCTNCYAMKLAGTRMKHHPSRSGLTQLTKAGPVWTGEVRFNEEWLDQPLRWKRPRMIFVCAHGDLFHESVPDEWIDRVFAVMALCPQHTFQVLTKRSARMRQYFEGMKWGWRVAEAKKPIDPTHRPGRGGFLHTRNGALPNVWLGVSVEDQKRANERIADLLATPAAIRWLSCEPLLGPVDLTRVQRFPAGVADREWINAVAGRMWTDQSGFPNPDPAWQYPGRPFSEGGGLDWIVAGGESGPGARAMHPDWARSLRDQCHAAGVPFFFKQWGDWLPWEPEHGPCWKAQNGRSEDHHILFPSNIDEDPNWDDGLWALEDCEHFAFQRVGKRSAGRLLDGREHNGFPELPR